MPAIDFDQSQIRTTPRSAVAWHNDQSTFAPADVLPQALILNTSTVVGHPGGDDTLVRVAYVADTRAELVGEGEQLPQAAPNLAETVISTAKISCLVPISMELWQTPGVERTLSDAVSAAVTKRANEFYLAQPAPANGAITPPAGLLNIAGIPDAGQVATNLDVLIDAIASVEAAGGHPSHLIMDPLGFAAISKLKTAEDAAMSLLGAGTAAAQRVLLGLPVIVDAAMEKFSGLVIDKTAVVSAVGQVTVATSTDAYFAWDSVALRATFRAGANVVRPDRLSKFTIAGGKTGPVGAN